VRDLKTGLRIHIAPVGFKVNRVTEPIIRERADKVYLITHSNQDKAIPYLEKILKTLKKEKYLQIQKKYTNIWDFFECLRTYKQIIREEHDRGHIYINISTGSKITSISGMFACMVWSCTPYYAHIDYDNLKKDPADGLPQEKVEVIDELPVYSLNKPRAESLTLLQILNRNGGKMKKSKLIEQLEEIDLIAKEQSVAAKHSRLKGLLHPITAGSGADNPLVEVEYRGKQSNVMLTGQGESTLKIFGD
jgi:CRISPR locus-related DNA-binding protein